MIKQCTCKNAFQDKRYGKGRRIHNDGGNKGTSRCTVCGDTKVKR